MVGPTFLHLACLPFQIFWDQFFQIVIKYKPRTKSKKIKTYFWITCLCLMKILFTKSKLKRIAIYQFVFDNNVLFVAYKSLLSFQFILFKDSKFDYWTVWSNMANTCNNWSFCLFKSERAADLSPPYIIVNHNR